MTDDSIAILQQSLERARQALDDWLCSYADDMVGEDAAAEAKRRIAKFGTISYISAAQEAVQRGAVALKNLIESEAKNRTPDGSSDPA